MRFAVTVTVLAWAVQFAGPAAADLYRWVDPETGSVKFSSYPPPWFGDPAQERRKPKVEVIPERSSAPSSGPKPDDLARPEPRIAPRPVDRSPDRSADRFPDSPADRASDRPIDRSRDRRVDRTPDGPGERPAAAPKEGSADER